MLIYKDVQYYIKSTKTDTVTLAAEWLSYCSISYSAILRGSRPPFVWKPLVRVKPSLIRPRRHNRWAPFSIDGTKRPIRKHFHINIKQFPYVLIHQSRLLILPRTVRYSNANHSLLTSRNICPTALAQRPCIVSLVIDPSINMRDVA